MKEPKGSFIPKEQKGEITSTEKLQGKSDRVENLSDPRWYKRPPNKKQRTIGHETKTDPRQGRKKEH